MNRIIVCLVVLMTSSLWADEATRRLALELSKTDDHAGAALEYRRLALDAGSGQERAAWFWASSHAYLQAGDAKQADRMLDRAEDADPGLAPAAMLLRGESAYQQQQYGESAFYFESTLRAPASETAQRNYAARHLAAARLKGGQTAEARAALVSDPASSTQHLAAVQHYEESQDKSPALGGWLGVVPGAGYAYAGEYANALRSLILNSLFIWGMVSTAEEDQWGGFAVITFFEITWYSGSIYGGVDASHRYNRRRLDRVVDSISAGAVMTPDYEAMPALRLRYSF